MSTEAESGEERQPVYKDHNLHIIFAVTLMAVLGQSSVSPAFPSVMQEFGVTAGQVALLITFFTLPGIALTPVLGVLSDKLGRKRVLAPALILFGIAGGACALARDFESLLLLRFLQGMGAAALGTLNVTLVGDLYQGRERSTAMGYNASVLSIATASYPALGGILAAFAWYYPFALPIVAVPIALLVLFSLHNPDVHNEQSLKEYFGNVWGRLKVRQVPGLLFASLATFIILFGPQIYYLPILMGDRFSVGPVFIGVVLSGASLVTALTSSQLGRLTGIFKETSLLKAAFLLYAIALATVPLVGSPWLLLLPAAVFGVAQGINIPNILTLLNGFAPDENRGAFMSVNGSVLRLGQTIGPLLMGLTAATIGASGAYLAAAGLAATTFVVVLLVIK